MQVTILLSIFTGTGGLQRAGATVVVVESGGVSTLFMLYCYRCVAAGTSNHFHAVGKSKFRKTNSVFLRCSHRRGNNFDAHFLCHPKGLVAAVKGIGQDFIRGPEGIGSLWRRVGRRGQSGEVLQIVIVGGGVLYPSPAS